jgi:hypothetical protein
MPIAIGFSLLARADVHVLHNAPLAALAAATAELHSAPHSIPQPQTQSLGSSLTLQGSGTACHTLTLRCVG